jgi:protocatechuate 3,4-dioxygenase beta subunit
LVKTATTDEQGNYKIENLPPGQYRVNIELRGFGHTEVWRFYLWRKARRVLDIGVPIGYTHGLTEITVKGQVRGEKGKILEEATITLEAILKPVDK